MSKKASLFNSISLSTNTVAHRTEDIGADISTQLKRELAVMNGFQWPRMSQMTSEIPVSYSYLSMGLSSECQITEELATIHTLKSNTIGNIIFPKVEETGSSIGLGWEKR